MKLQEIANFISTVGFPVFVAAYVLVRLEPTIKGLQQSITVMTIVLAKTNGVDYEEAKKIAGVGEVK
jgi:hypothetical protein